MADPKDKHEVFVDRLFSAVKERKEELANEGSVPGTGVSVWDLVKAKGALEEFEAACPTKLAQGTACAGDFNLRGGKKLRLEIAMDTGAHITVQAASGATRTMNVRPAPQGPQQPK